MASPLVTVGLDSSATQKTTRRALHGLAFNLLVVGPTGIGKTTLINSLFNFNQKDAPEAERTHKDVFLHVEEYRLQNKTIDMKLTIMETEGFNNQLDTSEIYKPIVDYIEARYDDYLHDEHTVTDMKYHGINDNRVHCCLYMISPTSRGLKQIDLITMKKLHQRVCLIPVIGRSDQLTAEERQAIKRAVMHQISEHNIEIYSPKEFDLPFAVSASDDIICENGKQLRVRTFPWGRMYIDRDSDFPALRNLLLRSRMLATIEKTHKSHYQKFRLEEAAESMEAYEFEKEFAEAKDHLKQEIKRLRKELGLH